MNNVGRYVRIVVQILGGLAVLNVVGLWLAARFKPRPSNLGVHNGKLADCPNIPNCVSSQSSKPLHAIAPLRYSDDLEAARARLLDVVRGHPRSTIVESTPTYIAAEYRSKLFGFPDDVEFAFDDAKKQVDVRSASRVGKGDGGVNRARIEAIRRRFNA